MSSLKSLKNPEEKLNAKIFGQFENGEVFFKVDQEKDSGILVHLCDADGNHIDGGNLFKIRSNGTLDLFSGIDEELAEKVGLKLTRSQVLQVAP